MTVAEAGASNGVLQRVVDERAGEDGTNEVVLATSTGRIQADLTIGTEDKVQKRHKDSKALVTDLLSALVIEATGPLMFLESSAPSGPVLWLNHDIIARQLNLLHV